jgi:hypothetical protein
MIHPHIRKVVKELDCIFEFVNESLKLIMKDLETWKTNNPTENLPAIKIHDS